MSVVDESARQAVRETMMRNRAEQRRGQTLSDVAASYGLPPVKPTVTPSSRPTTSTTSAPPRVPVTPAAAPVAPTAGIDPFYAQKLQEVAQLRSEGSRGAATPKTRTTGFAPGALVAKALGALEPRATAYMETTVEGEPFGARAGRKAFDAPLEPQSFAARAAALEDKFSGLRRSLLQLEQARTALEEAKAKGNARAEADLPKFMDQIRATNRDMVQTLADLQEFNITPQEAESRAK
jgi:hypothetical protein